MRRFSASLVSLVGFVVILVTPSACKQSGNGGFDSNAPATSGASPAADPSPLPSPKPDNKPGGKPGSQSLPEVKADKFNVAFVYVGPVGDGGWTYAHDQGRKALAAAMPDVHTSYIESVSEGADASSVIRSLARKGFKLIVTTSFGFMDATEQVAEAFPDIAFVHVSGFKSNGTNFGNLFGSMESMKYLAGMIAGARAKADGRPKLGYIAPFPIAEVVRLADAVALGMRQTCAECTLSIRWIHTWFDPGREKEAAESLLAEGADVIITGADSTGPLVAAADKGRWSIGYDSQNACQASAERCLTTPYWDWGPVYINLVKQIRAGRWKGSNSYLDVADGVVGLDGFMPGQTPAKGVPAEVVEPVRQALQKMQQGQLSRFDIFAGPLNDKQGKPLLPAGAKLSQEDLEGIKGIKGRQDCTTCMPFLVEGVQAQLSKP